MWPRITEDGMCDARSERRQEMTVEELYAWLGKLILERKGDWRVQVRNFNGGMEDLEEVYEEEIYESNGEVGVCLDS